MKKTKFQFLYSRLYTSVLAEFSQLYLFLSPYLSTPESVLKFDLDDDLGNRWTLTLSRRNISSPNRAFLYWDFEMNCVKYPIYFIDNHFTVNFASLERSCDVRSVNRMKHLHNIFPCLYAHAHTKYDDACDALRYFELFSCRSVVDGGLL